jgi:hypothetical protein
MCFIGHRPFQNPTVLQGFNTAICETETGFAPDF